MNSFKVEVRADRSGEWCSNALRFPTYKSAEAWGKDLFMRWTAVREMRVTACDDPVNVDTEGKLL